MPSDYAQIRKENIERYGWDTAVLDLLGHLYSERTHFIFELIQNAEDADATELTFELFPDRLQVRHDGRPFTEADVRGVCGVGKTSKSAELNKIGKFGIGFKSVYAYTQTPHIYSADENFCIRQYVRPDLVPSLNEPVPGGKPETLFVFPFDRDDPPAGAAAAEISAALAEIKPATLLFLRKIRRMRMCGPQAADAVLERVADAGLTSSSRHVMLTSDHGGDSEEWLTWARQVPGHPGQQVEIAFRLETRKGERRLVEAEDSPLVVFFPTAKETFLGFLIQGPYRTTPARDNIPQHDPWNQGLVRETAALLADVLRDLRDGGLLTVDVLQALPINAPRFQSGTMFRPLFESVREVIVHDKLIPLAEGGYGTAGELKLARGAGLRDLLSPELLGELYDSSVPVSFAADSITQNRTPVLLQYLRDEIEVSEVTPEAVVTRLSSAFLAARPDEWMGRFYAFLHQNQSLWRAKRYLYEEGGPARAKAIIRLEDGRQILPFTPAGLPAAYLPGQAETEFLTVRRAVADIPEARQFLRALSFTEPDVVAEVLEKILPRYANLDVRKLDRDQHKASLERIARALTEVSAAQRQHLHEQLRSTAFLVGENEVTGELRLLKPGTLYRRTADLKIYLDGNPDAWFLQEDYQPGAEYLRSLGVRDEPTVHARTAQYRGFVVISDTRGWHKRGLNRFDPDADISGLTFALHNPNPARSVYVWNELLSANHHLIAGMVESSSRQTFDDAMREIVVSPIGTVAAQVSWLPGPDGAFHRPAALQVDELPAEYKRDGVLAKALGMIQPVIEEASRQLGVPMDLMRDVSENLDWYIQQREQRKQQDLATGLSAETSPRTGVSTDTAHQPDPLPGEEVDYVVALSDVFSRPVKPKPDTEGTILAAVVVANPEFTRARVEEAIADDKGAEPLRIERFQQVPRRVWEAKDNSVRPFLIEQYAGCCQICGETFAKRDKTPYFEGMYLVSRTQARWIDRPGNAICLCATCCAKFRYGPVVADGIVAQVVEWRTQQEGGSNPCLTLQLCGIDVELRYTEKHLLDLQEMVKASPA